MKAFINIPILLFLIPAVSIKAFDLPTSESIDSWIVLQDDVTWIGWTDHSGFPVCQTRANFPYPMKSISNIIEDIENYPNVFKRITTAKILDDDIAYLMLDMPFPFSGRDYIIQFIKDKSEITNLSNCQDVITTMKCLKRCNVNCRLYSDLILKLSIEHKPKISLNCK